MNIHKSILASLVLAFAVQSGFAKVNISGYNEIPYRSVRQDFQSALARTEQVLSPVGVAELARVDLYKLIKAGLTEKDSDHIKLLERVIASSWHTAWLGPHINEKVFKELFGQNNFDAWFKAGAILYVKDFHHRDSLVLSTGKIRDMRLYTEQAEQSGNFPEDVVLTAKSINGFLAINRRGQRLIPATLNSVKYFLQQYNILHEARQRAWLDGNGGSIEPNSEDDKLPGF